MMNLIKFKMKAGTVTRCAPEHRSEGLAQWGLHTRSIPAIDPASRIATLVMILRMRMHM